MNAPDQDPLFDALRERLGGHERPPAPTTWEALAAQLQRRRRRRAAWWWFGGGAALLGLVLLVVWLQVAPPARPTAAVVSAAANTPEDHRAEPTAAMPHAPLVDSAATQRPAVESAPAAKAAGQTTAGNAATPAVPTSPTSGTTGGGGVSAPVVPAPTLVPAPAPAPDSVPPSEEIKLARVRRKAGTPAVARAARVWNKEGASARPAVASTKSSGASTARSVASKESSVVSQASVAAAPASSTGPKAAPDTTSTSPVPTPDQAADPAELATTPLVPKPVVQPAAIDTTHRAIALPGRWAFGIGVGAGLAHRHLGAGASPLAQAERPGFAGQAQLTVRYTLTPRLALSGGLAYATYQQRLRATIVRWEQEMRYVFHPATDSLGGGSYAWEYVPLDSTASRANARRTTALRYLTLPLAVEWNPRVAAVRWRPVLLAGATVQRLLNGRTARLNPQCDCEAAAENLRPWALGLTAAVGVDYALLPDFWLQVRPTATYLLTSATRGAAPARHPFSATVQVGLLWTPPRRPMARP